MALFKIFRGKESDLKKVPYHEGYAYFTTDQGHLYIDITSEEGGRVQVNAYAADVLIKRGESPEQDVEIDIDDILLKTAVTEVKNGGTGLDNVTLNALLIGNGTEPLKLVSIDNGSIVIGDTEAGIKGLAGTGALYSSTQGAPQFGTLPISVGGTGGTTEASARSNLSVYSKQETDDAISSATTKAYTHTLTADGWVEAGEFYTQTWDISTLTCGKGNNVPPIVSYTNNQEEYSKIDHAQATANSGITFYIKADDKPEGDIGIVLIDVQ